MGRVGTLAINRFLNDHPNVSLPNYKTTKDLFRKKKQNNPSLLDLPYDKGPKITAKGFMVHDAMFLEKKYRKALAAVRDFKVDVTFHVVRNPFDQAKSWINHINASAAMNLLGWEAIPKTVKAFYQTYKEHLQTIKPGIQCTTFYPNQKNVQVIEFADLLSDKIDNTMTSIYQKLGIDEQYQSPLLHKPQNNYTRELMAKGISFELNNEVIHMGMAPLDFFYSERRDGKPWIIVHDTKMILDMCPTLPRIEGDWVFLPKDVHQFNQLSLKTKKMVHENIQDIVSEVLPVWAKSAEQIAQRIESEKLKQLSDDDKHLLSELLRDDLDVFFSYHPQFKNLWGM